MRWNPLADGSGCWTVLGHAEVAQASRDFATFSSHEAGVFLQPDQVAPLDFARNLLLYMDPPQHTKYRLILQRAFTPHAVRQLEGAVRAGSRGHSMRSSSAGPPTSFRSWRSGCRSGS